MSAPRFAGVDALLADARGRLTRITPGEAYQRMATGDGLVDIRPEWQRRAAGEVPGALVVERNHLEWRLDPNSPARSEHARPGRRWIVICAEGFTSSLAADALNSIGVPATDVIDGYSAWRAQGLPTRRSVTAVDEVVS